jgi:hypothetical protein
MSTITGDAEFNNSNNNGTVAGESSFNGDSVNAGTVSGVAYFSDTSTNSGTIEGNAVFYDTAVNTGEVTEAAVFLDEAQNNGEIGVECTAAPVITQHPENVYNGPSGSFVGTSYSVRAEENPWVDVSWNVLMNFGGNAGMSYSIAGPYAEWKDLTIPYMGGLPGEARRATINCRLSNGVGEVHATEAEYISGDPPALVLPPDSGNVDADTVNVTEGEPLIFVFSATSAAYTVTVGATRGSITSDPIAFEGEFNTTFDVDSLVGRRKIALAYLNAGRLATREDNGVWRLKITDPIGSTLSPYDITVNVTNVDVAPTITTQPVSASGYNGEYVTFTVEADDNVPGDSILSYQWKTSSNQNLEGQTLPSLTIHIPTGLQGGHIVGSWRCNITSPRFNEGIDTDAVSATSLGDRPPPPPPEE